MNRTWTQDITGLDTEDITCTCAVHPDCETLRVPASLLVNPSGRRTTPRFRQTAIHNLINMNRMFRQYPVVG